MVKVIKRNVAKWIDLLPEDIGKYNDEAKELIRSRAKTCQSCSNLSSKDNKCIKCDCSFPNILLNKDKHCPIKKW